MTQPKLPTGWWLWNTRQSEMPGSPDAGVAAVDGLSVITMLAA